ncbi:hypothetical protein D3C87_79640 [compost metagenome]
MYNHYDLTYLRIKSSEIVHKLLFINGQEILRRNIIILFNNYYYVSSRGIEKFKPFVESTRLEFSKNISLPKHLHNEIEELLGIFESYIVMVELMGDNNHE